jgi:DNA-binding Lrp family transcriptional regulator
MLDEVSKHISEVVYVRDEAGNATYVSPSSTGVLGIGPDDLLKPMSEWPLDFFGGAPAGTSKDIEATYSGGGQPRRFILEEHEIKDEAGCIRTIIGILKDMSDIEAVASDLDDARASLKQMSLISQGLLDVIPSGAALVDTNRQMLCSNQLFKPEYLDNEAVAEMIRSVFESGQKQSTKPTHIEGLDSDIVVRPLTGDAVIVLDQKRKESLAEQLSRTQAKPFDVPVGSNERKVLYGVCAFPEYNNRQLSEITGVKVSTVNSILNKMRKNSIYRPEYVLDPRALGYNIISLINYRVQSNRGVKLHPNLRELIPQVIYHVATKDAGHLLLLSKDIGELEVNKQRLSDVCKYQNFNIDLESFNFSLNVTEIVRFFNYSNMLRHYFSMGATAEAPKTKSGGIPVNLSRTDKAIIKGLVEHPDLNIIRLSKKIGVSRPTLSKKKEWLRKIGIIKMVNIPSVSQLGQQFLTVYVMDLLDRSREKNVEVLFDMQMRSHLLMETGSESISMALASDYSQVKKIIDGGAFESHQEGIKRISVMPLQDIVHESFDLKPLLNDSL